MGMRYADLYKREIRGNECCGFWRVDNGGNCAGWPRDDAHECPADEDGSGCPLFGPRETDPGVRIEAKKDSRPRLTSTSRINTEGLRLWDSATLQA